MATPALLTSRCWVGISIDFYTDAVGILEVDCFADQVGLMRQT